MEKTEEMQGSNARWGPDCILGQGQDGTVGQLLRAEPHLWYSGVCIRRVLVGAVARELWDLPYCGMSTGVGYFPHVRRVMGSVLSTTHTQWFKIS